MLLASDFVIPNFNVHKIPNNNELKTRNYNNKLI